MTRALVLFAHPCPESFSAALHREVVDTLAGARLGGGRLRPEREGFSPVLTEAERRGYHEVGPNIEPVRDYVDRLRAAEALVMVFPVWNFGYPAILKGFSTGCSCPACPSGWRRGGEAEPDAYQAARRGDDLWWHAGAGDARGRSAAPSR
jgi:hypothetical protein